MSGSKARLPPGELSNINPKSGSKGDAVELRQIITLWHHNITYVDKVSFLVNHDVSIMPIFNLKEEADDAIGRHGGDEVLSGTLEALTVLFAKLFFEVVEQVSIYLAPNLVA